MLASNPAARLPPVSAYVVAEVPPPSANARSSHALQHNTLENEELIFQRIRLQRLRKPKLVLGTWHDE